MRSVLRLDLDGPVTEALRTIIEEMLDQEASSFADEPCTEHIYRRVLLVDRWLADYSTTMLDEVPEGVDPGDFGVCPLCFEQDVRLNIHRSHWLVCHKHRVCWYPGRRTPLCSELPLECADGSGSSSASDDCRPRKPVLRLETGIRIGLAEERHEAEGESDGRTTPFGGDGGLVAQGFFAVATVFGSPSRPFPASN
ncbi:MAG: hypothetical protein ACKVII_18660 [Planctomycetales bacterium]